MIKSINTGTGLQISNSYFHWPQFYNSASSSGNTLIGQIRYNGSGQVLEVYDGSSWLALQTAHPTVELAPHVQSVVQWAQNKMAEESRLKELAVKHASVADAVEAVAHAEEQLRIVAALVDTA